MKIIRPWSQRLKTENENKQESEEGRETGIQEKDKEREVVSGDKNYNEVNTRQFPKKRSNNSSEDNNSNIIKYEK